MSKKFEFAEKGIVLCLIRKQSNVKTSVYYERFVRYIDATIENDNDENEPSKTEITVTSRREGERMCDEGPNSPGRFDRPKVSRKKKTKSSDAKKDESDRNTLSKEFTFERSNLRDFLDLIVLMPDPLSRLSDGSPIDPDANVKNASSRSVESSCAWTPVKDVFENASEKDRNFLKRYDGDEYDPFDADVIAGEPKKHVIVIGIEVCGAVRLRTYLKQEKENIAKVLEISSADLFVCLDSPFFWSLEDFKGKIPFFHRFQNYRIAQRKSSSCHRNSLCNDTSTRVDNSNKKILSNKIEHNRTIKDDEVDDGIQMSSSAPFDVLAKEFIPSSLPENQNNGDNVTKKKKRRGRGSRLDSSDISKNCDEIEESDALKATLEHYDPKHQWTYPVYEPALFYPPNTTVSAPVHHLPLQFHPSSLSTEGAIHYYSSPPLSHSSSFHQISPPPLSSHGNMHPPVHSGFFAQRQHTSPSFSLPVRYAPPFSNEFRYEDYCRRDSKENKNSPPSSSSIEKTNIVSIKIEMTKLEREFDQLWSAFECMSKRVMKINAQYHADDELDRKECDQKNVVSSSLKYRSSPSLFLSQTI